MPTKHNPEPVPDAENPEWTRERIAKARRLHELPQELQQAIANRKRGPQKAPTKTMISLRLSPDVLAALRASGKGWQSLADDALRQQFVKRPRGKSQSSRAGLQEP